jgi:galactonate dehydratase
MTTATQRRRARLSIALAAQAGTAPAADRLRIAELRLHPVREPISGRLYAVVEVRTREGITGFGEAPETSPAEFARARRFWEGRAATAYATAGVAAPLGGAMNMAALDIMGKAAKAPVYRLLGGPTRSKARVFASLQDGGPEGLERAASAGYRAFGIPVPRPAARNQGKAYQDAVRKLLEGLRAGHDKFDFILEAGGALTPGDAASVAATVERLHPLWFDEPCGTAAVEAIRKIGAESVVPLGFGRDLAPAAFQELLREGLIDIVRPDIAREGILGIKRIAAMAEPYYTAVAPRHSGGPIATAAALHAAAAIPNFFIQQVPLPQAPEDAAMRRELAGADVERITGGFAALPTGPGLGIAVNTAALEKYHAA